MGRKKRDLSFEIALGKVAGLKPHAVHYQMARLLNELTMGCRMTEEERKNLYNKIRNNDAYKRISVKFNESPKDIQYNTHLIYQSDISDNEKIGISISGERP